MINLSKQRICVTGGNGFLGKNIVNLLAQKYCDVVVPKSQEYDLRIEDDILRLFQDYEFDIIIHAASHSGGIGLNQAKPGELFYDNAMMGIQLMEIARQAKIKKFVQLGTICEYPKFAITPFSEWDLWNGYPEDTNAPYGISKKALLVMGQAYRQQYGMNVIHLLPVNLYGPGDNFDPETSHVIPALIQKFVNARIDNLPEVTVWGDGKASREFLYVEDCAEAIVKATELYNEGEPINIGTGSEITIANLSSLIAELLDYGGKIKYDNSKPNGQPRRCLNVSKAKEKFGFEAKTKFKLGLSKTIMWYLKGQINEHSMRIAASL
jgi:GDP-L-fucose synthase